MASNRRSSTVDPATITSALGDTDAVSPDDVFDCLADGRRRYILEHLRESGSEVDRADVAEAVASRETDADGATESDRDRTEIQLHHVDIPKLADTGLVEYDSESGTVTLSPEAETILDEL